jgi:hypothetical protein
LVWSMLSKYALMSASSTKLWPRLPTSRMASSACVALRFGRNP